MELTVLQEKKGASLADRQGQVSLQPETLGRQYTDRSTDTRGYERRSGSPEDRQALSVMAVCLGCAKPGRACNTMPIQAPRCDT